VPSSPAVETRATTIASFTRRCSRGDPAMQVSLGHGQHLFPVDCWQAQLTAALRLSIVAPRGVTAVWFRHRSCGTSERGSGRQGVICRLPGPAVEKSGEILRKASTPLKLAQRLDQRSFFVVEELHLRPGICGEPRLENHAEIVGRGVGRARLELLDEQLGGFRRDREVPLVDRHAELLGDEPPLLGVAHQLIGRARRLSAPRGDMASPKLAAV
jgi:hypothetical protein